MHGPPTPLRCINQDWVVGKKNVALISIPVHAAVRAQEGTTGMNMSQDSFCHPLENYRSFLLSYSGVQLSIDEMLPIGSLMIQSSKLDWSELPIEFSSVLIFTAA